MCVAVHSQTFPRPWQHHNALQPKLISDSEHILPLYNNYIFYIAYHISFDLFLQVGHEYNEIMKFLGTCGPSNPQGVLLETQSQLAGTVLPRLPQPQPMTT